MSAAAPPRRRSDAPSRRPRTRIVPDPRLLVLIAAFSTAGVVLHAHDPGLSALDVSIGRGRVSVLLSMSAPDVALAAPGAGDNTPREMGGLALRTIQLRAAGQPLVPAIDRVWMEDGAAYVQLQFSMPPASTGVLTIASHTPARLARGHRQLLTVRQRERVVGQHLLDAGTAPVSIALGSSAPPLSAGTSWRRASGGGSAAGLFGLGVRHILGGIDHLVFLAGLLLASRRARELAAALTAFTIAHSLTLGMAAIGAVHVPPAIVEPLIAASIAWIGLETLLRNGRPGVRWMVVFAFGLVHGFGFAEALTDLGRWSSPTDIVITLVSFNAGVEAGQLAVAAAVLPMVWLVRSRPAWNARLAPVCSVLIACAGGYWLIARL
jgi:hydrogenase/urease accessory protein HupE